MFCVRSLPQPNGPANALDLPMSAHTRRDGPDCRASGRSVVAAIREPRGPGFTPAKRRCLVPGSGQCVDPYCQTAARARPALPLRVAFDQAQPGRHRRLSAWRSIASSSGSAPISRTSCAQRQATAILAAHCSASSREGTSTSVNPPMASGYGPSVTAPSVATMLAGWFSSPPADTYTPALMASWTAACAALATAGASSSGRWSITWAPNEIRYCVIHDSVVPAARSGRVLTHRRTTRPRSHRSARRNFSRVPAVRPRERHVTRVRGDHRRCRRLRAVQPPTSDAATVASVRLCRRAEPGHLLTGAVPWQTERQPRIFGREDVDSASGPASGGFEVVRAREDINSASGPASLVLRWYGRRVGGLGPGLTSESADAVSGCPATDLSAGSQVFYGTHRRCRSDLPGL